MLPSGRVGELDLNSGVVVGGDFRVLDRIGEGGMSVVYAAEQLSTGRRRALKIMRGRLAEPSEGEARDKHRAQLEREAKVGALVESPHVVDVVAAGVDEETPWIAMELLDGDDLAELVRKHGPRDGEEVRVILTQLFHAVAAAHRAGVVHRDLKPENVFVSRDADGHPWVKVLDFGIARLSAEVRSGSTTVVGSPAWMAPEQADSDSPITPATDVWALGLITYWLITGSNFWRAADPERLSIRAIMREVLLDPIPLASQRAATVDRVDRLPKGFDAWFEASMRRDHLDRIPDAGKQWARLEAVMDGKIELDALPPELGGEAMDTAVFLDVSGLETIPASGPIEPPQAEAALSSDASDPEPAPASAVTARDLALEEEAGEKPTRRGWAPGWTVAGLAIAIAVGGLIYFSPRERPPAPPQRTMQRTVAVPTMEAPVDVVPVSTSETAPVDEPVPTPSVTATASVPAPLPVGPPVAPKLRAFDIGAAQRSFAFVAKGAVPSCKQLEGPTHISVGLSFLPDGSVRHVVVHGRSPREVCVKGVMAGVRTTPFDVGQGSYSSSVLFPYKGPPPYLRKQPPAPAAPPPAEP